MNGTIQFENVTNGRVLPALLVINSPYNLKKPNKPIYVNGNMLWRIIEEFNPVFLPFLAKWFVSLSES